MRFRTAYNLNFTQQFINFIKSKIKLREPIPLSTMGKIRGGKSYGMISVCVIHQAMQGRLFNADYICANEFEFMEKLKDFPQEKLTDRIFLVDEEKQAVYSAGSTAKKMKATDISNIIAINNISVIRINPTRFPSSDTSWYGVRVFGRDFNQKINRFMLYNLQEGGRGSSLPMGMIYIPIFTKLLPKKHADKLEKDYLEKKNLWVMKEQRGEMDVLAEMKKKVAQNFIKDEKFLLVKKKDEKFAYITQKLGSEWTTGEKNEILALIGLLRQGIDLDE